MTSTPRGVRRLSSGRFQARYTGPDGLRHPLGTFRTRTDAQKALLRVHMQISSGEWLEQQRSCGALTGKTPLSEWLEDWVAVRSRAGRPLEPSTSAEYRRLMRSSLIKFDKPICLITEGEVRTWWSNYRLRSPRAANAAYKLMKTLLTEAVRRGAIVRNPCDIVGASTYSPKDKVPLPSATVVRQLISGASFPWQAFFALAAHGGLRRGEIAELRRDDIQIHAPQSAFIEVKRSAKWDSNNSVRVGYPKWDSSRAIPLGPRASEEVIMHLDKVPQGASALLFSQNNDGETHLAASTIRAAVAREFRRIGYGGTLHSMRDFALTSFAQAGATIAEIMHRGGHRDFRAAMAYQQSTGRDQELARQAETLLEDQTPNREGDK